MAMAMAMAMAMTDKRAQGIGVASLVWFMRRLRISAIVDACYLTGRQSPWTSPIWLSGIGSTWSKGIGCSEPVIHGRLQVAPSRLG